MSKPYVTENDSNTTSVSRSYLFLMKAMDLFLGLFFLLLSAPVFLLAALAIRIESKGNPFFLQERVGYQGKKFKLIKLRGMYIDSKERFPELYDYTKSGKTTVLDFHFHYESDPRVTRVGSFTRRTSIDELPNFINVVLGDMSLVGPRPEVPEVFEMYGPYKRPYMAVKPGITCVSKCTGRDKLTKEETLAMDFAYLKKRSIRGDLSIIWKTALNVFLRRDVH